jgi:hypothetical protein
MHPFTGLATREDGAIKVCCRSQPIGWIQEESLESAWNNKKIIEVRRQVLAGERPDVCKPCFDLEDQGVESLRQRHIKGLIPEARINLYPNTLDNLREDYTMPFEFPTMEIKLNNLCNLKCRMCGPTDSNQWYEDWVKAWNKEWFNDSHGKVELVKNAKNRYVAKFDDYNWFESEEFWKQIDKSVNLDLFTKKGLGEYLPNFKVGVGL